MVVHYGTYELHILLIKVFQLVNSSDGCLQTNCVLCSYTTVRTDYARTTILDCKMSKLLVSSLSKVNKMCFVQGQGQKNEQKIQQRALSSFVTI